MDSGWVGGSSIPGRVRKNIKSLHVIAGSSRERGTADWVVWVRIRSWSSLQNIQVSPLSSLDLLVICACHKSTHVSTRNTMLWNVCNNTISMGASAEVVACKNVWMRIPGLDVGLYTGLCLESRSMKKKKNTHSISNLRALKNCAIVQWHAHLCKISNINVPPYIEIKKSIIHQFLIYTSTKK